MIVSVSSDVFSLLLAFALLLPDVDKCPLCQRTQKCVLHRFADCIGERVWQDQRLRVCFWRDVVLAAVLSPFRKQGKSATDHR